MLFSTSDDDLPSPTSRTHQNIRVNVRLEAPLINSRGSAASPAKSKKCVADSNVASQNIATNGVSLRKQCLGVTDAIEFRQSPRRDQASMTRWLHCDDEPNPGYLLQSDILMRFPLARPLRCAA